MRMLCVLGICVSLAVATVMGADAPSTVYVNPSWQTLTAGADPEGPAVFLGVSDYPGTRLSAIIRDYPRLSGDSH